MNFFERLEELIKEQNVSKKDLAAFAGITTQSFYDWSKRNTIPAADIALKIAQYLNTSVEYLLTGVETNEYKIKYDSLRTKIQKLLDE